MGLLEQMKRERERRSEGRVFGLYRGIVTNVNDPKALGRIRAKVHELLGDTDETDWAWPCVPFGGGGAGWLMLPKTNDAVWIAFEAGDLSRPVWVGFWFNKTDTPPDGAGPDVRVLQSKAGHRVEFGDADGGEFVRLSHSAGTVIEMDADGNVSIVNSGEAGDNVKLGSGVLKKLVNETLRDLFNNHTHPYQNGTPVYGWAAPPASETQPPSSTVEDSHLTEQTIAS
jgi:uncharacterized protein involved in type VI secretion and phage assembly